MQQLRVHYEQLTVLACIKVYTGFEVNLTINPTTSARFDITHPPVILLYHADDFEKTEFEHLRLKR